MATWIFDDFLKDPLAERELALSQEFKAIAHNGLKYRGISLTEDPKSVKRIERKVGAKFSEVVVMHRRYLQDEVNETYIHSDVDIATFTAILFLNLPEQCRGGTAFWRNRKYGFESHPSKGELEKRGIKEEGLFEEIYEDGFDESKWELLEVTPMKFNRLIVFWSPRYHSRYPMKAFGTEICNSRLVKVFFCKVSDGRSTSI